MSVRMCGVGFDYGLVTGRLGWQRYNRKATFGVPATPAGIFPAWSQFLGVAFIKRQIIQWCLIAVACVMNNERPRAIFKLNQCTDRNSVPFLCIDLSIAAALWVVGIA